MYTCMFVLKVYNTCINCLLGVVRRRSPDTIFLYIPPAPHTSKLKTHADQLIFYIKVSGKRSLTHSHQRKEGLQNDSIFSIVFAFGSIIDCQQINHFVFFTCCHSDIPLALKLISYPKFSFVIMSVISVLLISVIWFVPHFSSV